jgi:hypothetical protein
VHVDRQPRKRKTEEQLHTVVRVCARHGHVEIVRLSLKHGADRHALNDKGKAPDLASLRSRRPEIADLLARTPWDS